MITKKEEATKAYELGMAAFHAKKRCIPASDKKFLEMLKGMEFGTSIHISRAWTAGYITENLKALV